jgi:phosphoribosyl 1,2-cyclic phosphodiesterase
VKDYFESYCQVSNLAIPSPQNNPIDNKNYRNNPSLLLQSENGYTTVIDVGKTFREGALRWFPKYNIGSIDDIILTHEHMDAAGGLDDVRGFQKYDIVTSTSNANGGGDAQDLTPPKQRLRMVPMPLHLSNHCYCDLQKRFPWLLPNLALKKNADDAKKPLVQRHVASFDVQIFESFQPFLVNDGQLAITPLPVMHGEDLISFGFAFTIGTLNVVYLSDISRMLPETLAFICDKLPPTDILVLDALHETEPNAVHYNLQEALALVDLIRPKQTYFVGMSCDSFLSHDEMNRLLREKYGNVALAHDGLEILA